MDMIHLKVIPFSPEWWRYLGYLIALLITLTAIICLVFTPYSAWKLAVVFTGTQWVLWGSLLEMNDMISR
jgi:hypothetical protein